MLEKENLDSEPSELFELKTIVVDPKQGPVRLDKFLITRLERASRNKIQNAIRNGAVKVDEKEVKPNFKIKPGQVITMLIPRHPDKAEKGIKPQNIPLDIRYEDDDVIIVHKEPGMVVHPGIGVHDGTLVNALAYYMNNKEMPILPGNEMDRPGLVHRIDKNTSGLMVIAKTEAAMTHLAKQFFDHSIERTYQALIWGEPDDDEGTIEGHIGRHQRHRLMMHVFPEGETGKEAITHYKMIERLYYISLIECKLETGRTHQIRVHMKHIGHPIFNDERYGGNKIMKGTVFTKYKQFVHNCFDLIPRQALHAKSIGFVHPTTGEQMHFESDLPEDMQSALDKWRNYVKGRKELV